MSERVEVGIGDIKKLVNDGLLPLIQEGVLPLVKELLKTKYVKVRGKMFGVSALDLQIQLIKEDLPSTLKVSPEKNDG